MHAGPVFSEYFADPFVLRTDDGTYYAYGTPGPDELAGERRFRVLASRDLVHWSVVGRALVVPPALRASAFWAPEVAHRDGVYHLFYSAGGAEGEGHRIRVAHARAPAGPFEDAGCEVVPDEPFSIDASPFRDPRTGRWWLFFVKDFFDERVGSGIAVAALADDMRHIVGPVRTIRRADADWQIFGRGREWYGRRWDAWYTVEGPCVVHRGGRFWLFYSGGLWKGGDYGVDWAVGDAVDGPYVGAAPADGARLLRATPDRCGPGHNCVVTAPDGTDVLVYHAWDPDFTARRMYVAPLAWSGAGPRLAPS